MPHTGPVRLRSGGLLQSGIPKREKTLTSPFYGLVRAVVVATYCCDADDHPLARLGITPTAVYCDVLCFGSLDGGSRYFFLPAVQVTQPFGGMHKGSVYKPKATTRMVGGKILSDVSPKDVHQMDGDHVLVGFCEGKTNQPIIVGFLPHPSRDMGDPSTYPVGKRQRLKLVDGDPMFFLHHGSYFGVDSEGAFVADTTLANSGQLDPASAEVPTGPLNGDIKLKLPPTAQFSVSVCQSAAAGLQTALTTLSIVRGAQTFDTGEQAPDVRIECDAGNALAVSGAQAGASLKVGDGSAHVALAEPLATWWNASVVPWLVTATGSPVPPPVYAPSITSGALTVPSRSA